jgi:hypothetical protein
MAKKSKRQKTRRLQQKRASRAAKEKKRRRGQRQSPSPIFSGGPSDLPDQQTLVRGLMEMESLADEPEFDDFELGEHAIELVAEAIASTDKDIGRLEESGDEEAISQLIADATSEALHKAVTPAVKGDIRRRLDRLCRRLRREGQTQRAEHLAALASMLDFPPFPWEMFEPVRRAFDDVVGQTLSYIILHQSVAEAAGRSAEDIEPDEWGSLLEDPEVMRRLEAKWETDEVLQEVMDSQYEKFEEAFTRSLLGGQLDLALFADEELAVGIAYYEHALGQTEVDKLDRSEESYGLTHLMVKASTDALRDLSTPARRQRWLEHLEQARTAKAGPPDIEMGLRILGDDLSNPPDPEGPTQFLLSAYLGELYKRGAQLATDSSTAAHQRARVQEIKERLERGESPLT